MSIKITDKDLGWKKIVREMNKVSKGKSRAKAGWVAGEGGDTLHIGSDLTNAEIMTIHEYGSPANNIPPRPVMANSIKKAKRDINKMAEKEAGKVFAGFSTGDKLLEVIGEMLADYMKLEILAGDLKPTVDGRKPLYVTGQLYRAISSKVED